MNRNEARALADQFGIDLTTDFHALPSDQVDKILQAADSRKYRKPKDANGSRARYFHAFLVRKANQKTELEIQVQGHYGQGWECVAAEESFKAARQTLKEYRDNSPGAHRIRQVRVAI